MTNKNKLSAIIDIDKHPINSSIYRTKCKRKLDNEGVLVLTDFLLKDTIKKILKEANKQEDLAYYCVNKHNVYLEPSDPSFQDSHPRNKTVISSKGCITDNQVPSDSYLRFLYNSKSFKEFLCEVLSEEALYKYDDELSSINIHYAKEGQELGWHFDNSSFAITLLIQKPISGGRFEYIRDFRNSSNNENNYKFDFKFKKQCLRVNHFLIRLRRRLCIPSLKEQVHLQGTVFVNLALSSCIGRGCL
jgi:hypothetical protein